MSYQMTSKIKFIISVTTRYVEDEIKTAKKWGLSPEAIDNAEGVSPDNPKKINLVGYQAHPWNLMKLLAHMPQGACEVSFRHGYVYINIDTARKLYQERWEIVTKTSGKEDAAGCYDAFDRAKDVAW